MTSTIDSRDLAYLARIAEGMASQVPDAFVARLLAAGLVQVPDTHGTGQPELELTPAGLDRIRSSDQ